MSSDEQAKSAQVNLEFDVYFQFPATAAWTSRLGENEFRREFLVCVSDMSCCDFTFL